jgi:hypothetical protein
VLPPCHESFVDDLCGIVSSSFNVYAFLHNAVASSSKSFPSLIAARLDLGLRPILRSLLVFRNGAHVLLSGSVNGELIKKGADLEVAKLVASLFGQSLREEGGE